MYHNKLQKISIAAVLLIASQLACQTLLPNTAPTVPPTPSVVPTVVTTSTVVLPIPTTVPTELPQFSDDEIKGGIQATLDQYAQAYNDNKPDLLDQVVDQENKPFRRIVRSRFDEFQDSYQAGSFDDQFTLLDITRRDDGFVLAHFENDGGYEAVWPFRFQNGNWVISEPTVEQMGKPATKETDHFIFTYYPWADDVNPRIMELMENARQNVQKVLGKVPDEKANVEIMPGYGLHPFEAMNAIASYYQGTTPAEDKIRIYSPNSFAYSFYDSGLGWEGELEQTLTHEYTHMTHTRSFNKAGRSADWMSEGLAEYVSGAKENSYWACDATRSGTFIPILDESGKVYKQDLMHMYGLDKNFGLSYDFATSVVEFTVQKFGGLDGFWKLAQALDQTSDFKQAVQKAFGITYDQYNSQWQAWLRKKC